MIIKELSKFIVNLDYDNIPKTTIEKAKLCLLDFLGVANRGFLEESVQIALKSIDELFGFNDNLKNQKSSIIGNGHSNILIAGFINGISAHALDLDDGHRFAQLHPGATVFSSALAVAEANNVDGKKFLESVICGYEVAIVLGKLVNPYHRNQGFHTSGTIGTFSAGAVASKLLDLDLKRTINALGLCGTQSSGLLESDHMGTMGKQLHLGKSVSNGILSAYLAKNGFTGAESIMDGDEGFLKAMSFFLLEDIGINNTKNYLNDYLNKSIGKFHINEVYLKKYPFCRHLHSSIDSIVNIKDNNDLNIDDIDEISIITYKIASNHNNFNPKNKEDIKQSLPYAVAFHFFDENEINRDKFNLNEPKLEKILKLIKIEESEEFNKLTPNFRPSKIIIKTSKGNYENSVMLPKGEAENPFSKEDILKKFESLNPNFNLDNLKNINDLEFLNIVDFMKKIN